MTPEVRQILKDVAAGELGPVLAGRAATALARDDIALEQFRAAIAEAAQAGRARVTMAEIDAARAKADAAIAARRAYQAEERPRRTGRGATLRRQRALEADVAGAEAEVLTLLERWWAQGCQA